jgi:hypothetical protein
MSIAAKCTCGYGPGFCTDRISHCINRINFLNMSKDHTADLDLSEAAKLVPEEIYEWICTKAKERFQSGREGYGFKMGAIAMYHHDQEQIQNLELQINELNKEVEYWISTGKYLNQIGTEEIKTLQSQIIDYRKVLQHDLDCARSETLGYKEIWLLAIKERNYVLELLKDEQEKAKMYSDWYQDAMEMIIGK